MSLEEETEQILVRLETSLPLRTEAARSLDCVQVPFLAQVCGRALLWRLAELSREAFELHTKRRTIAAAVLTRAAVETAAALSYLRDDVAAAVAVKSARTLRVSVNRLLWGTRRDSADNQAPRVRAYFKAAEKHAKGITGQYSALSELAHPNSPGTALTYSAPDPSHRGALHHPSGTSVPVNCCMIVVNLYVALRLSQRARDQIDELTPILARLCEREFAPGESE